MVRPAAASPAAAGGAAGLAPAGAAACAGGRAARPRAPRPAPAPTADATIVDSPSRIERLVAGEGAAPVAAAPPPRDRRLVWVGVALGGVAVAALLVGRGMRKDTEAAKPVAAHTSVAPGPGKPAHAGAVAAAPVAPPSAENIADRLGEARRLIARGDWEQARTSLETLRAEAPDDAESAYLLATIDLEHHRFAEGMTAAQAAIKRNPALKSDPDLIKDVIGAPRERHRLRARRGLSARRGGSATPFLKDAAHRDPNPRVRDRAAALLGSSSSSWSRSSSSSSFSRSSSRSSSGSSVFHR